jgi:hypothetical protein
MEKRGVSNVEFVLAFVLFVSFVAIAFFLFNPIKNLRTIDFSASYSFDAIVKNASIEMDSYSIKINNGAGSIVAILIPYIAQTKKARVENYYDRVLPSNFSGGVVYFQREGENFAVIKFSDDFQSGGLAEKTNLDTGKYTLASAVSESVVSEKRMLALNQSYIKDYTGLKKNLNIPDNVEFSFNLQFQDGYIISGERTGAAKLERLSETKRLEVLRNGGSAEFAYLTVQVW